MRDLEERVCQFVAKSRGVCPSKVTPRTTLLGDLGTDGDDAQELLAFAGEFGVELSAFEYHRHFGPEGFYPWSPIIWIMQTLRKGTPEERAGLEPITVGDLVRAARINRWSYEEEEGLES